MEIAISADPLYQHLILTAEKMFRRCVESGAPPRLFDAEAPRPRIEAIRIVDMSSSNSWGEFAGVYCRTREAFLEHETALRLVGIAGDGDLDAPRFSESERAYRRSAALPLPLPGTAPSWQ